MIKIAANKLKHDRVLITEPVYIRTEESDNFGSIVQIGSEEKFVLTIKYKAYLSSEYDKEVDGEQMKMNAPSITIDGLQYSKDFLIDKTESLSGFNTFEDLYLMFNQIYVDYIKSVLNLSDEDIEIL